ncbi:MAG: hypothetical protein C0622_06155 [Desulfuromonas sp.]|nr:MAG: hypothetical protein C0622_06155 [Desulfuromonas sp.]
MKSKTQCVTFFLIIVFLCSLAASAFAATYQQSLLPGAEWDATKADRLQVEVAGSYQFDYGEECLVDFSLPWEFPFYDSSSSRIYVDGEGNIWLGSLGSGPRITVWNGDLDSYYGGGSFVEHKSDPERIVVQWSAEAFEAVGYGQPIEAEVILYDDGNIRFNYADIPQSNVFLESCGVYDGSGASSQLGSLAPLPSGAASFDLTYSTNNSPIAYPASVTVAEDNTYIGVLSASDPDGDALSYSVDSAATSGSVVVTDPATGAFSYTPDSNFSGVDSFTFVVNDGQAVSNTATVQVVIDPVNDAPVSDNDSQETTGYATITGMLLATDIDGDTLTYSIVSQPNNGSLNVNTETGEYSYTPYEGFSGDDSFTFKVNDGSVDSNISTIEISVLGSGLPPESVPVMNGWWIGLGLLVGIALLRRRSKC